MKRKHFIFLVIVAFVTLFYAPIVSADPILGSATSFAALGASAVSDTGPTTITGDLGVYPGTSISGLGSITVTGTVHLTDAVAQGAQADALTAYNALRGFGGIGTNLSGQNLGSRTLPPGVYSSSDATALLNGALILDAGGINGAFWIFKLDHALTTGSADGSSVQVTDFGTNNGSDVGVFWLVGSSATLGTSTAFEGNIIADQSITLVTSATIENGRAIALNAALTMDTNTIENVCPPPNGGPGFSGGLELVNGVVVPVGGGPGGGGVPEPATMLLLGSGLAGLAAFRKRFKKA